MIKISFGQPALPIRKRAGFKPATTGYGLPMFQSRSRSKCNRPGTRRRASTGTARGERAAGASTPGCYVPAVRRGLRLTGCPRAGVGRQRGDCGSRGTKRARGRRPLARMAGARGSRTHRPDRRAGANGFEVREAHRDPSAPAIVGRKDAGRPAGSRCRSMISEPRIVPQHARRRQGSTTVLGRRARAPRVAPTKHRRRWG